MDDEIILCNICTDLVSLRKTEAFPLRLLQSKGPGEWVCVRELCQRVGVPPGDLSPEVFATWLPDPIGNEAYAVILFFDDESKWTMAAHYNRGGLSGSGTPNQACAPAAAALPVAQDMKALEAAPVAEL